MLGAICFGAVFGFPFIAWGLFLMFDRDRTWQKQMEKSKASSPPKRTPAWDMRQRLYGAILIIIGTTLLVGLALINLALQSISPPAPF